MAKKKTRPPEYLPVTRLRVDRDQSSYVTRAKDPNERWDADDTCSTWAIERLYLIPNDEYGDVTADFPVNVGDQVYLMYAVYSTGDSFGHSTDGCIDFISVHRNRETAEANRVILEKKKETKYDKKGNFNYTAPIQMDSGVTLPYHCPWLGYFESLSGVHIEQFTVEAQ